MSTKTYIWISVFMGSIIGGWIGGVLDHGNLLGAWSFSLGTIGALGGVWVGYKLGQL